MRKIKKIFKNFFGYARETEIHSVDGILVVLIISTFTALGFWVYSSNMEFPFFAPSPSETVYPWNDSSDETLGLTEPKEPIEKKFIPQPFTMDELKTKGCVADGMLSNYGRDADHMAELIDRSPCLYLHRSLETWASPPNFDLAERIIQKVEKPRVVYGMFLAEAVKKDAKFRNQDEDYRFNFGKMCKDGTDGMWGEETCLADFDSGEYREYIKYITRRAMDLGIQNFLFGQIFLQESADKAHPRAPKIIEDMRDYAKEKGLQIVIGAQTNAITDPKYIKLFDYIEGGVGLDTAGNIENGPCWSGKSSCWALLWHPNFASKAKNVFLNLDWNGVTDDDMSRFARMDQSTRIKTLKNLYTNFTSKGMGFMMPYLAVLNKDNPGGCYGPKKNFYTPDNKYKCKDEDQIGKIMIGR